MGIITVKLSQLRLSPLNQRRVKPSAVESMADDIAAHVSSPHRVVRLVS